MENFYIITGNDYKLQMFQIQNLVKGKPIVYVDTVEQALNKCRIKGLFTKSTCYIVREDNDFIKNDKLWDFKLNDNILVLMYQDLDKRKAFYKKFKKHIKEINHPDKITLIRQLRQSGLEDKNLSILIDRCENDLGRIILEIDKIQNYADYNEIDINKSFVKLLKHNFIYKPPVDAIFDFVDAVLARKNKQKIYELLNECYNVGENNLALMKTLGMQFEKLLILRNNGTVEKLPPTVIQKMKNNDSYSNEEICNIIKLLHELDYKLKVGKISDDIVIEYLLTNII